MSTIYAVRAIAVRDEGGAIVGWVRTGFAADGTSPSDQVYLRDGSACDHVVAVERIAADLSLLYVTREEAIDDGIRRLRAADADGGLPALFTRKVRASPQHVFGPGENI